MNTYTLAVQVPAKPSADILALPCVLTAEKVPGLGTRYLVKTHSSGHTYAIPGNWICRDTRDRWHVLADSLYRYNRSLTPPPRTP